VERCEYVQYLVDVYLSSPNKLCANGDAHLHRNLSKQQHVELLRESSDRILGSDTALLIQNRLNV
jgi:hypothetical protein